MAQNTRNSSIVNQSDGSPRPAKPPEPFHPHYFTTFQNFSCGPKAISAEPAQNKALLPIPTKFKDECEDLLKVINTYLIEDLTKIATYTSVIPSIFFDQYDEFHSLRYLIDRIMLRTMTEANIINWISSLKKLHPIRTSGNGNCLLHAVLIAMVGVHDLSLYLRDRLVQFMGENKDVLKNHWKIERLKSDKNYGINSEDSKLDSEWDELCNIVRYENSEDGQTATNLPFLESVHIFSISNLLHRPIIVISEDVIRNKIGEAISPNDLYGIYLPIISPALECIREPIVLIYDQSHFCPLQAEDIPPGRTPDNLLPLYPSINHTYDQTLLPIRFLGNDINEEQQNKLLHEYLKIEKISYSFDSNSPSLSLLCAELGTKHLSAKYDFFLLYHKYIKDFFEVQKPKALEEERQLKRQRELDDYVSRHAPYGTNDRSIVREAPLSSSSISPRSTNNMNDIQSPNQNDRFRGQGTFYDDPTNHELHIPDDIAYEIENNQPGKPLGRTTTVQPDSHISYILRTDSKQGSLSNINNLDTNDKAVNITNINPRENDFKLKQEEQRTGTRISIPVTHTSSPSPRSYVIDSEPRTDFIEKCVTCDRYFHNPQFKRICSDCDYKIRYAEPAYEYTSRSRPTHIYPSTYTSGFAPVLSSKPKPTAQRIIHCPRCRNPNRASDRMNGSDYYCSACGNLIPSVYL